MKTYKMKINTVGELIDFLKGIPKETEIEISECGQTGYVDKPLEVEKVFYGCGLAQRNINIRRTYLYFFGV